MPVCELESQQTRLHTMAQQPCPSLELYSTTHWPVASNLPLYLELESYLEVVLVLILCLSMSLPFTPFCFFVFYLADFLSRLILLSSTFDCFLLTVPLPPSLNISFSLPQATHNVHLHHSFSQLLFHFLFTVFAFTTPRPHWKVQWHRCTKASWTSLLLG